MGTVMVAVVLLVTTSFLLESIELHHFYWSCLNLNDNAINFRAKYMTLNYDSRKYRVGGGGGVRVIEFSHSQVNLARLYSTNNYNH